MLFIYKTKRDINGHIYYLIVDPEKKTYKRDYDILSPAGLVAEVSKREREKMAEQLSVEGFIECY